MKILLFAFFTLAFTCVSAQPDSSMISTGKHTIKAKKQYKTSPNPVNTTTMRKKKNTGQSNPNGRAASKSPSDGTTGTTTGSTPTGRTGTPPAENGVPK